MKKIIVNGYGWTGSSAFIDFLGIIQNDDYFIIPGEFDDFRVPGTMRECLTSSNFPRSQRAKNIKTNHRLFVRSLVPDKVWPNIKRGSTIRQKDAKMRTLGIYKEKLLFNRQAKLMTSNKNNISQHKLLADWMDRLCAIYSSINSGSSSVFIEQFFLFDDDPKIYDWFDFDKLILFIRRPETQLNATLESVVLYNDYPWVAEFLIGRETENNSNKYELFIKTTVNRYSWIKRFLDSINPEKIIVVDFDSFLYDTKNIIELLSKKLDLNFEENLNFFDIKNSRSRDLPWDNSILNFSKLLQGAQDHYEVFKADLSKKYFTI